MVNDAYLRSLLHDLHHKTQSNIWIDGTRPTSHRSDYSQLSWRWSWNIQITRKHTKVTWRQIYGCLHVIIFTIGVNHGFEYAVFLWNMAVLHQNWEAIWAQFCFVELFWNMPWSFFVCNSVCIYKYNVQFLVHLTLYSDFSMYINVFS